jgi:hypothetical protein
MACCHLIAEAGFGDGGAGASVGVCWGSGGVCCATAAITNKALIIAVEITAIALRSMRGIIEEGFERANCRVRRFPVFSKTTDMSFHPRSNSHTADAVA